MNRSGQSGCLADRVAELPAEQASRYLQRDGHHPTTHRSFTLAVAGLAAFAAVACLPAPAPGTASRASGFPTGDPPRAGHVETTDDSPPLTSDIDFDDWCYDLLDSAVH